MVKDILPHTTLLKDIKGISANHEMLVESEKEGTHIISTSTVQKEKKMMSEENMRKGRENQPVNVVIISMIEHLVIPRY